MKKVVFVISMFIVTAIVIFGMSSFTKHTPAVADTDTETHVHSSAQGTHCNGIVGCSCSGFSPITNGEVWQEAYCKNCGHKKSQHK